jgi:transposase-like protein
MTTETEAPEVSCPFCESRDVERLSRFGTEISKQAYRCRDCQAPFERLKYDGQQPDTGR